MLGRQLRDQTDAVPALRHLPQQAQAFNLPRRVQPSLGRGSLRLDGAVALFPDPDGVRAQSSHASDHLNGIMSLSHFLYRSATRRPDEASPACTTPPPKDLNIA